MSNVVTVDEDTKARLEQLKAGIRFEQLKAEIRLETGTEVILQELLSHLIDDMYSSREDVVDSFRPSDVPLSDAEKEAMAEARISTGESTEEDDIDEILYG